MSKRRSTPEALQQRCKFLFHIMSFAWLRLPRKSSDILFGQSRKFHRQHTFRLKIRESDNAIVRAQARVPVVQRIEQVPPKNQIQVRFLVGTPPSGTAYERRCNVFQTAGSRPMLPSAREINRSYIGAVAAVIRATTSNAILSKSVR